MTGSDRAAHGLNIRQRLTLIVLAVAVPMLLLSAAVVWRLDLREREVRRDAIMYAARANLSAVDAQLGKYVAVAQVLAASPSLQQGDLVAFRAEAARAMPGLSGPWVSLADTHGQQVVNTLVAAGQPLPGVNPEVLDDEDRAFATRQVQISSVVIGPVAKIPVISVGVPVLRAGEPAYFLMIGADVNAFRGLLNSQRIPEGWLAGVMDRSGRFIVRSLDHDRWVGKLASPGWRAVIDREGWFDITSVEGDVYMVATLISPLSGWVLGTAAKTEVFEAPIRRIIVIVSLAGLLVTLLSVLLAVWVARRITLPISALASSAMVLRARAPMTFSPTRVPEIDQALGALATASREMLAHETQLENSEERLRAVVDTAVNAILVIDEHGTVQSLNPAAGRIFGYQPGEVVGNNVAMLMPEPDRSAHDGYLHAYRKSGQAKVIGVGREVQGRRKDGTIFPVDLSVAEWRVQGTRYFTGIIRDITERKRAEEHIRMVMRELSHRTKNVLAVVQAMAWKTARTSTDLEDFEDRFASRVQALACSHDLLTEGEWQGVQLEDLVRGQLHMFGADKVLDMHGPDLLLRPEAAQSLGLALHELATNASKYGALTRPAGRVKVSWGIDEQDAAAPRFWMRWRESGGPEVVPAKRTGFGHIVITDMTCKALQGEAAVEFNPDGFSWQLSAPADACFVDELR